MRRRASLPIVFGALSLAGCGAPDRALDDDRCEEPAVTITEALSSIDCTESTDTGYTSGNPFPITVVTVDGKPVEVSTANAYYVMAQAAEAAGVGIAVVSGFRTMAEQEYLYGCYVNCSCNNCNLAAKPGYSNHQSGHALDLNTSAPGVYDWLSANAGNFGFSRTVPSEPWHWEFWGGGPGGGPCGNKAPSGWLDSAGCESVKGWTQDPDEPGKSIDVHLYFGGPAGSGAVGKGYSANVSRSDLCSAIGSCEHGFDVRPPLSLFDGAPHAVHAYGIDSEGGANAELSGSPQSLVCTASVPTGIRRHVQNPDSLAAWKFDLFWSKLPLSDAQIASIPEKTPLPLAPSLVQADDGSPEVWLVDGTHRRHVPDPTALFAWSFAIGDIQIKPAAEVGALTLGPPLRPAPVLVQDSAGKLDLIDDPMDGSSSAGSGGSGGSGWGTGGALPGKGGTGGSSAQKTKYLDESDEGCGCRTPTSHENAAGSVAILLALIGVLLRKKRALTA